MISNDFDIVIALVFVKEYDYQQFNWSFLDIEDTPIWETRTKVFFFSICQPHAADNSIEPCAGFL